jgi:hypothetical protein
MSAMSTLDLLFQELRETIQNNNGMTPEGNKAINARYQTILDTFPMLTMQDAVDEFGVWLKERQSEEREEAKRFMSDHFKIISVM